MIGLTVSCVVSLIAIYFYVFRFTNMMDSFFDSYSTIRGPNDYCTISNPAFSTALERMKCVVVKVGNGFSGKDMMRIKRTLYFHSYENAYVWQNAHSNAYMEETPGIANMIAEIPVRDLVRPCMVRLDRVPSDMVLLGSMSIISEKPTLGADFEVVIHIDEEEISRILRISEVSPDMRDSLDALHCILTFMRSSRRVSASDFDNNL